MPYTFNPFTGNFDYFVAGGTGPQGPAGAAGTPGADGDSGEDGFPIVGPQGPQGIPGIGIQGAPGITILLEADQPDDPLMVPGPAGVAGANGTIGRDGNSIIGMDGMDGEDGFHIPGPQGIQGIQGIQGFQGLPGVALFLEPDQPDIPMLIPGPQGIQGPQGPAGSGSSAAGVVLNLDSQPPEEPFFYPPDLDYDFAMHTQNGPQQFNNNVQVTRVFTTATTPLTPVASVIFNSIEYDPTADEPGFAVWSSITEMVSGSNHVRGNLFTNEFDFSVGGTGALDTGICSVSSINITGDFTSNFLVIENIVADVSAGTHVELNGIFMDISTETATTITSAYGFRLQGIFDVGSTITNLYGAYIQADGGGSITNRYQFYSTVPAGTATNDWGFYEAGTQPNNFNGVTYSPAFIGSYSPGSFTVNTEQYAVASKVIKLTGAQQIALAGTSQLRIT